MAAPREAVFGAIAERADWPWFPGLTGGRYEGPPPYGVGTSRDIRMAGVAYHETIVAWTAPSRWAFRVDECSVPIARALVEEWTVRRVGRRHDGALALRPRPRARVHATRRSPPPSCARSSAGPCATWNAACS